MTTHPSSQQPVSFTLEQALQQGIAHHQAGQLQDAERFYRAILQAQPHHPDANHNLGVLAVQVNQPVAGLPHFKAALEANPNQGQYWLSYINALIQSGRQEAARDVLEQGRQRGLQGEAVEALAIATEQQVNTLPLSLPLALGLTHHSGQSSSRQELPEDYHGSVDRNVTSTQAVEPDAYTLGRLMAAFDAGRYSEAESIARNITITFPRFGAGWKALGTALHLQGRVREALQPIQMAVTLLPKDADVYYDLGVTCQVLGRLDEAETCYQYALQIKPDYAEAHNNLGTILKTRDRFDEAEVCYRRALEIKPDYVEAHNNLGNTFKALGRFGKAEACYHQALEINPDYAEAHYNLGNTLQELGRLGEAEASYRRALQIKPDYVEAHSNLIFLLDMADTVDFSELRRERDRWDEAHAAPLWQPPVHSHDRSPDRRLRVGYVSADFREHSAPKVFGGMLTYYDRSQFEVYAYSNSKRKDDRFTELFKQSVTVWRDIGGLADEAVAQLIREDRIDILVDLSGHTAGNRLLAFARKPAPIQITAWGFAAGTGMRAMDVFFADSVMVPPQDRHYFSEEVRYLPSVVGSFFTEPFPDVNELPALSDEIISFGSLNRLAKVTEKAYRAWGEILLAVPRSRLILKTPELNDASVRERVAGYFTKAGVAAERVIMQGSTSWVEHMQTYHRIDLGLDTFPLGGGVTTMEGLMMGVPVITLRWRPTVAGGVSASIMATLGLPDWVAETEQHYVELAIRKAADLQSLAALRRQLRGIFTSSVIGDPAAYARAVEQEYRQLWREWCAKN